MSNCKTCPDRSFHMSDCSVNNKPALPVGPCDCGLKERTLPPAVQEVVGRVKQDRMAFELLSNTTSVAIVRQVAKGAMKNIDDFLNTLAKLDGREG